ncbi:hypothetical protein D3C81_2260260 [compost metagenome]
MTASAAGVVDGASAPVGMMLPRDGLILPATRLISAPAFADCSLSAPMRSCTWAAAAVAWLYLAATSPTFD